jgi:hypothetical protein
MTSKSVCLRLAVAAAAVAAFSLAACGGSSSSSAGAPAAAAATAVDRPSPDSSAGSGSDDCAAGAADAVKKAVTSSAVTKIQVIGGCSQVSIETSLPPTAKADGVKICDEAAKVAYTGDVVSISVGGSDGHELSAGFKGNGCI